MSQTGKKTKDKDFNADNRISANSRHVLIINCKLHTDRHTHSTYIFLSLRTQYITIKDASEKRRQDVVNPITVVEHQKKKKNEGRQGQKEKGHALYYLKTKPRAQIGVKSD